MFVVLAIIFHKNYEFSDLQFDNYSMQVSVAEDVY